MWVGGEEDKSDWSKGVVGKGVVVLVKGGGGGVGRCVIESSDDVEDGTDGGDTAPNPAFLRPSSANFLGILTICTVGFLHLHNGFLTLTFPPPLFPHSSPILPTISFAPHFGNTVVPSGPGGIGGVVGGRYDGSEVIDPG